MARGYHQYCPIAHALDCVGERWSLLVVRELQHGPLRYTDLFDRLPGCSTNILAARLRDLESTGVIARRQLPPPAASTVYELTDSGRGLSPVLRELAHWGARSLGPPTEDTELPEHWLERALRTAVGSAAPPGTRIALRCGEEEASVIDGSVVSGVAEGVTAFVDCDPAGFYHAFVHGDFDGLAIEGDRAAVDGLIRSLRPSREAPAPV